MSQLSRAILGSIAVALTFGAVQLASGRDLAGVAQNPQNAVEASAAVINRTAKADRAAPAAGSAVPTQTISLRLNGLSDTSVLVRIPAVRELARNGSFVPSVTTMGARKATVACEPVVSVLTDVARQLEPGRCVT